MHDLPGPLHLFLPCAAGVESLLGEEVQSLLPHSPVRSQRGGVALQGAAGDMMALNLGSRLAQRVLIQVAHGPYRDETDLYRLALGIDWAAWITPRHTLRVDTTAHRCPLKSLNFAALRIKDAVCDRLRDATGERPNVDTSRPDLPLLLHLDEQRATLYVDSSGVALFKRGWREDTGDAPLKETLAAAMLAAAGWRGSAQAGGALHDPCCGSGTIAIEAAQIACGMAPGLKRRFAFQQQLPFCTPALQAHWQRCQSLAQAAFHASAVPIFASDVSFRMVDFARRNARRAGVEEAIVFNGGDALERAAPRLAPDMPGTLMLNPPYGERIEALGKAGTSARAAPPTSTLPRADDNRSAPSDFFARLASHWKRAYTAHPAGWTAYVLSPDMKLPGVMRLKESRRVPLWNGPIECRLFRFDLLAGSARTVRGPASVQP
ncbi:MAG: THUMP domain-containing protein [Burkholderiaceae bacterium]